MNVKTLDCFNKAITLEEAAAEECKARIRILRDLKNVLSVYACDSRSLPIQEVWIDQLGQKGRNLRINMSLRGRSGEEKSFNEFTEAIAAFTAALEKPFKKIEVQSPRMYEAQWTDNICVCVS